MFAYPVTPAQQIFLPMLKHIGIKFPMDRNGRAFGLQLHYYKENDIVKYGGYLYICNTAHTSAISNELGLEEDQYKWDLFCEGLDWKGDWYTSARYKINDLVKYNGTVYLCNEEHTSSSLESTRT